jgi:hypothetical protein
VLVFINLRDSKEFLSLKYFVISVKVAVLLIVILISIFINEKLYENK